MRRQYATIQKTMISRLANGESTVLVNPIYTISPIATVNKFKEEFHNCVVDYVDETFGLTHNDTMVNTIMDNVDIRGSNHIFINENVNISIADIVKMLIGEVKTSQRDSYNGNQPMWPKLAATNNRLYSQFAHDVDPTILALIKAAKDELNDYIHTQIDPEVMTDSDDDEE
jgi:hypothetical protein